MIVAASTECFPELSFDEVLPRLDELQFTALELTVHEKDGQLKPSEVHADLPRAIELCRATRRLTLAAISVEIEAEGDEYYAQFCSCCKMARGAKVVALTVPSSELGAPFNAEVERLQELVKIASSEGVLVGMKTETGRMTEDPSTAVMMCDHVKGLGVTLDPSHYIYGPHAGADYEPLMKYVYHVHLRDTSKEQLQVRVGQGEVEYGRLVTQLTRHKYDRTLSVNMTAMEGVDHDAEMRKMRLLLESLL